ncbi:MAG: zinc/manganese transport system permease protein [Candidatus Omnitrophota bacterium]|jgi:zinc/manganese transport system permease protein
MIEFFSIMTLPLIACVLLTAIYSYLGLHVIEREVIFVDLAIAQIAILGGSIGLLWGFDMDSAMSYRLSLGFALLGAGIFSLTRSRKQKIPQEAIIGITYAVSAALLIMVLSSSGEGDQHIRQALVGNILLVNPSTLWKLLIVSIIVGFVHFIFRKQLFLISKDPEEAYRRGIKVKWWDFLFYASFGFVVTSSVKLAGVLLVFSYLVVPAVSATIFTSNTTKKLILAWSVGLLASLLGMVISYFYDFPTGASVVSAFGAVLLVLSIIKALNTFFTASKY